MAEQKTAPRAPRADIVETLHGESVADPFRPLEDLDSPQTRAWVRQQEARTRAVLDAVPTRSTAEAWYHAAWDVPKTYLPTRRGELYFYSYDDGKRAQTEFRVRRGLHGEGRTLLDPNLLSADGTIASAGVHVSRDGRYAAYLLSEAGSDVQEMRIREVETGRDLPEVLKYCRWSFCAWDLSGASFLYNRCAAPEGPDDITWMRRMMLCRHRLGTEQGEDEIVIPAAEANRMVFARRFKGMPRVGLDVRHGTDERNGFRISRGLADEDFRTVIEPGIAAFDAIEVVSENGRDVLYAITALDAPRGRIVAIDLDADSLDDPRRWRTIIPESDVVLHDGRLVRDKLLVFASTGIDMTVRVHRRNGTFLRRLDIPGPAMIWHSSDDPAHPEVLLGVADWLHDGTIWRYDDRTREVTRIHRNPSREDLADATVDILWATSRDGTRIPMSVIRLPETPKAGSTPVLMTGYGGFGVPLLPSMNPSVVHWVRRGGIYVTAHLRGGGEFGQAWHDAGRRRLKQNTFDDFIACAETLVAEGWTRPERLAIEGGSNGGLLVSACMVQRPDLFGAVIAAVPVTDMLRFQNFTAGGFWTFEYGSPEDPEDFAVLRRYSPVHNVLPGGRYPPVLILTGDHDDRVVPSHAYKFAATLQETANPDNIVLLRVDRRAGHGAGKPKEKTIAEWADIDAFLAMAFDR